MVHKSRIIIFILLFITGSLLPLTVQETSMEELTLESGLIIHGKVLSIDFEWEDRAPGNINTFIEIEVLETLKGIVKPVITVRQLGGKIGDFEDIIAGSPRFTIGEEVVLFLKKHDRFWVINSIALGAYKVFSDEQGNKTVYNDLSAVKILDPRTGAEIQFEEDSYTIDFNQLVSDVEFYLSK